MRGNAELGEDRAVARPAETRLAVTRLAVARLPGGSGSRFGAGILRVRGVGDLESPLHGRRSLSAHTRTMLWRAPKSDQLGVQPWFFTQ